MKTKIMMVFYHNLLERKTLNVADLLWEHSLIICNKSKLFSLVDNELALGIIGLSL